MNTELELKIQACVDNELSPAEARRVMDHVRQDPEARRLFDLLADTSRLVSENEPEHQLPESREFYWSKIEREISRSSPEKPGSAELSAPAWSRWWKLLAIAGGAVALVALMSLPGLKRSSLARIDHGLQEIESPLDEVSAITFHSESANMTVVWVQQSQDFDTN
jgi:hypothetical protein